MVMAMFLTTWNPKSLSILKNSVCLMLSFEECADVLGIGKQFSTKTILAANGKQIASLVL